MNPNGYICCKSLGSTMRQMFWETLWYLTKKYFRGLCMFSSFKFKVFTSSKHWHIFCSCHLFKIFSISYTEAGNVSTVTGCCFCTDWNILFIFPRTIPQTSPILFYCCCASGVLNYVMAGTLLIDGGRGEKCSHRLFILTVAHDSSNLLYI